MLTAASAASTSPKNSPGYAMAKNTNYTSEQWKIWKRGQRAQPNLGKCVKCGKPATDRAHMGAKTMTGPTRPYCRACHTRRDNLAGLH